MPSRRPSKDGLMVATSSKESMKKTPSKEQKRKTSKELTSDLLRNAFGAHAKTIVWDDETPLSPNQSALRLKTGEDNVPKGILLDFARGLRDKQNRLSLHSTVVSLLQHKDKKHQDQGMQNETFLTTARQMVARDSLHYDVLQQITRFWRTAGRPEWCRPPKSRLKLATKELGSCRRMVNMLKGEVDLWVKDHMQHSGPEREPEETLHDRRKRVESFWEDYHMTFRRMELPPQAYPKASESKQPAPTRIDSKKQITPMMPGGQAKPIVRTSSKAALLEGNNRSKSQSKSQSKSNPSFNTNNRPLSAATPARPTTAIVRQLGGPSQRRPSTASSNRPRQPSPNWANASGNGNGNHTSNINSNDSNNNNSGGGFDGNASGSLYGLGLGTVGLGTMGGGQVLGLSHSNPPTRPSSAGSHSASHSRSGSSWNASSPSPMPVGVAGAAARAVQMARLNRCSSVPASRPSSAGSRGAFGQRGVGGGFNGPLGHRLDLLRSQHDLKLANVELGNASEALQKRYHKGIIRPRTPVPRSVPQGPSMVGTDGSNFTPTMGYLWECENQGSIPTTLPFVTGHSFKLSAWDRSIVDNDLINIVAVMKDMSEIEEVDVEGNTLLTDTSLVPMLENLFGSDDCGSSLKRLSLKSCQRAGPGTVGMLTNLLQETDGALLMRHLDLSGMAISAYLQPDLCRAIKGHPHLRVVKLANVGLGIKSMRAAENICLLMGSASIRELDLSWNCFTQETFKQLADRLVENQKLKSLSLANTSAVGSSSGDAPILYFIEELAHDVSLTKLDISLNRLGLCGTLVIEDALQHHKRLEKLNINSNPLGVLGMRSLLRLLSHETAGLMEFDCVGCSSGLSIDTAGDSMQMYNATNPGGRYHLNLERPYHRAILRLLYKACDRFKVDPKDAFEEIVLNPGKYVHAERKRRGVWAVPRHGQLDITFSVERGMQSALQGKDDYDFAEIIQDHYTLSRLRPSFRKVTPLLAQWRHMTGHEAEQIVLLEALSKDFCLSYSQIAMFANEPMLIEPAVERLLHCVSGQTQQYLLFMLLPTLSDFVHCMRKCAHFINFNVENPTAHYKLRLEVVPDYVVAEQLLLLDRWESNICRRNGVPPVSQKGDYTRIRNEYYNGHHLMDVKRISDWILPVHGVLEFDYVSARRPKNLKPLDQETFDSILFSLHVTQCDAEAKVWVMRALSHWVGISAMQLRELMGAFLEDFVRAELFVCFVFRVVDMWNEKVFRVKFASRPDLMKQLRNRLGEVTLFPFIQPEQAEFSFDLAIADERLAASLLIYIAAREGDNFKNVRNPKYIRADGTPDRQFETTGISRSWEDVNRINDSGVFSCLYVCSPNEMRFDLRRQFFETYGRWKVEVPQSEIHWWAALTEAPDDVLEFLEFLVSHFADVWEAFRKIDGPDGNGALTLREFETSLPKVLGCNKFEGPNEKQRIANVFRYLDPSGEGEVSLEEWGALQNLWHEMQQSIREFVQFLERIYGNQPDEDFLDIAWREFDDDGSGSITSQEWTDKALHELKYFGPSEIIFRFLDQDDEGTVSFDEFQHLETFRRRPRIVAPKTPTRPKEDEASDVRGIPVVGIGGGGVEDPPPPVERKRRNSIKDVRGLESSLGSASSKTSGKAGGSREGSKNRP